MKVEKVTKRHNKNFTISPQSCNESIRPKEQHKKGRSSPDRDSNSDNKLKHFEIPFLFLYI